MTTTNFTVRFMREMQPVQYEKAQAMVELSGSVEEGGNILGATEAALEQAKRQVLRSLGIVTVQAKNVEEAQVKAEAITKVTPPVPAPEPEDQAIASIPTAKTLALAEELGVDWHDVIGSGKNGRVTMKDVQAHVEGQGQPCPIDETQPAGTDPELVGLPMEPETGGDILDMGDEVPEPAVEEPASEPASGPASDVDISYEDLLRASSAAAKKVGGKVVRALIASYGVAFLREVPAEKRAELLAELNNHV